MRTETFHTARGRAAASARANRLSLCPLRSATPPTQAPPSREYSNKAITNRTNPSNRLSLSFAIGDPADAGGAIGRVQAE